MMQRHGEINIRVITVWFGNLPSCLPYFLETCAANRYIDWLFVSDQPFPSLPVENMRPVKMSKAFFADRASKQLGFDISIEDPQKLCDFKPLFGKIFEEYLYAYQYWGYCDMDMVFGDIRKHIQPLLLEKPDVIAFYPNFLSGPFCLYRNINIVNNLYSQCTGYQATLQDPEHKAFDEHIPRKVAGIRLPIYRLIFLLKIMLKGPRYRLHGPEIRYQFQWYAKKLASRKCPPLDMTDIVYKANRDRLIRAIFRDLIKSDRAFRRQGWSSWKLSWKDGTLIDTRNGEDLFAYHFVDTKNNPDFVVGPGYDHTGKFIVSEKGIERDGHGTEGK